MNSDRKEVFPGKPKTLNEQLRRNRAKKLAKHIKIKNSPAAAASMLACADLVWKYAGTDFEQEIWELYKAWTRPKITDIPELEGLAKDAGLVLDDFIGRAALHEMQKYIDARPRLSVDKLNSVARSRPMSLSMLAKLYTNSPKAKGERYREELQMHGLREEISGDRKTPKWTISLVRLTKEQKERLK